MSPVRIEGRAPRLSAQEVFLGCACLLELAGASPRDSSSASHWSIVSTMNRQSLPTRKAGSLLFLSSRYTVAGCTRRYFDSSRTVSTLLSRNSTRFIDAPRLRIDSLCSLNSGLASPDAARPWILINGGLPPTPLL